ncbi:MAG: hypothetical protein QXD77_00220 [Candidatus Aenigmatarchaeota archaeon]
MKKLQFGALLGIAAGVIDVALMVLQNLTWDANISAFFLWVVSGFLIAATDIKLKGALKGLAVSFLVLLPSATLIGWKEPISLAPIFVMTLILGSALGILVEKYGK